MSYFLYAFTFGLMLVYFRDCEYRMSSFLPPIVLLPPPHFLKNKCCLKDVRFGFIVCTCNLFTLVSLVATCSSVYLLVINVLIFRCITMIWQLLAVCVATVSTSVYILLQLFHFILSYGSDSCIYATFENLFSRTWKNIRVRCCQILYWPVFLHNNDSR